jgi:hypothetical protein
VRVFFFLLFNWALCSVLLRVIKTNEVYSCLFFGFLRILSFSLLAPKLKDKKT